MRCKLSPSRLWPWVILWLGPDVIAHYSRAGRSLESRINAVLRKAAKLPKEKRK